MRIDYGLAGQIAVICVVFTVLLLGFRHWLMNPPKKYKVLDRRRLKSSAQTVSTGSSPTGSSGVP